MAGFDIDILKAIAKEANIQIRFVDTPWEGIFDTLTKGERDMLISAITINDERMAKMEFSKPYFMSYQVMAVRPNVAAKDIEDLKNRSIAVQKGTTGDQIVSKFFGNSNQIRRLDSMEAGMEALKSGEVDAVVGDNSPIMAFITKFNKVGLKAIKLTNTPIEHYGIAIKKGDVALLNLVNKGLSSIRTKGAYDAIYTQYFGEISSEP